MAATARGRLDVPALEQWLWDAACQIRGPLDAPKYKDYILPLVFLKRLSDVFDDEVERLAAELGDARVARDLVEQDHRLVRFYLPPESRWSYVASRGVGLGESLTDSIRAVARQNPRLQGVIDVVDFNATAAGQRIVDDTRLRLLVQVLSRHRLGLQDVEPDILGRAYEYLIRKFAEGQGQSAGEFYTPREVAVVMARVIEPEPGMSIYDPCCGSGGLLIKCHLRLLDRLGMRSNGRLALPPEVAPLQAFGQEINPSTFAMSRMNAFIHDVEAEIALGDTMTRPAFSDQRGRLRRFDVVVANPMWNQDFSSATYDGDPYARFGMGAPPSSTADWGWVQHMLASLSPTGRMAVILDTGSLSRGSGNQGASRERAIRAAILEEDLLEAAILLPENLFYNTPAPGIIMVLNRQKRRPNEVLMVNAAARFSKGRPKNFLSDADVEAIVGACRDWQSIDGFSAVVHRDAVVEHDFNFGPTRFVSSSQKDDLPSLTDALMLLRMAEDDRRVADDAFVLAMTELGLLP